VVDPSVSIGHVVTGAIEGKFEHGYLISIMMGTEKLRGVLYHLPPGQRGLQHADLPNCVGAFGAEPQVPSREIPIVKSSGRKHRKRKKDPNAPRANRSGYNFYFGEQHLKLKALHPNKERELSRMIGEAWNRLTDEEKLVSNVLSFVLDFMFLSFPLYFYVMFLSMIFYANRLHRELFFYQCACMMQH
jgi:hypothetical protein